MGEFFTQSARVDGSTGGSLQPFDLFSLRSRRYSRAQGGKLEIPPAQKLSILSSPAAG